MRPIKASDAVVPSMTLFGMKRSDDLNLPFWPVGRVCVYIGESVCKCWYVCLLKTYVYIYNIYLYLDIIYIY